MTVLGASSPGIDEIRTIGLFGGLGEDALLGLLGSLEARTVEPGKVVFREGDDGRAMYVVLTGELEVTRRSKTGHDVRIALLGPRDWFGEMALLEVRPRSATVRTLAPSRLLQLSSADLNGLYRRNLKAYALLMMNLAREMSRRLRVTDGILANTVSAVVDRYTHRPSSWPPPNDGTSGTRGTTHVDAGDAGDDGDRPSDVEVLDE